MSLFRKILYVLFLFVLVVQSADAQTKRKPKKKYKGKAKVVYYKPPQKKKPVKIKYIPPPPAPKFDFSQLQDSVNPIYQVFLNDTSFYNDYLAQVEDRRIQIIFTRIDRDRHNTPYFSEYKYRVNPYEYFYPASTVKLPLTAMCLEKLNTLNIKGLTKETNVIIDSSNACQYATTNDSTSANYKASMSQYIKKILLVSDNDAYNRMYEFLGPCHINRKFQQLNMKNARVTHRFTPGCDEYSNRITNKFTFFDDDSNIIYTQEPKECNDVFEPPTSEVKIGNGYIDYDGKLKKYPKDFTGRNFLELNDINQTLKRLMFPESYSKEQRFDITERDLRFMRKYMSMYATESVNPFYDAHLGHFDAIKKYLIFGQMKDTIVNKNIRIFNIVGFAYGFLVDVAYIIDFETNTEFMLAATIYSNNSGILNSNMYDYYTIGMPFLKRLGQDILKIEQKRIKQFTPNLDYLKFDYKRED